MARLGTVFNFNFTILHAKAASDSLKICEHLRRYLKEFWTIISIFSFFFLFRLEGALNGECEVDLFGRYNTVHSILSVIFCRQPRTVPEIHGFSVKSSREGLAFSKHGKRSAR